MRATIVFGAFLSIVGAPAVHAAECASLGNTLPAGKFSEAAGLCLTPRMPLAQGGPAVERPFSVSIAFEPSRRAAFAPLAGVEPRAGPHDALIDRVSLRYRIDPALLGAMVHAESRYRVDAVSPKGALGLMQVMPDTARSLGVAQPQLLLADPELAVETGAKYLKQLQDRFGNNVTLVVAAYNAGPGAVERHGRRVPPYRETQGYVRSVLSRYASTRQASAAR